MRPTRPTDRADRRRAALLLSSGLGWLRGFPTAPADERGLPWCSFDRDGRAVLSVIDRPRLDTTTRALHRLSGDLHAHLVALVPDGDALVSRARALLTHLKGPVHLGTPAALPGGDGDPLHDALRWLAALDGDQPLAVPPSFAALQLPLPLHVRLVRIGEEAVIDWFLTGPLTSRHPAWTPCEVDQLTARDDAALRRLARLLDPSVRAALTASRVRQDERTALLAVDPTLLHPLSQTRARRAQRLNELAEDDATHLGADVQAAVMVLLDHPALVDAVADLLPALPDGPARARWLRYTAFLLTDYPWRSDNGPSPDRVPHLLTRLARALRRHLDAGRSLEPWAPAFLPDLPRPWDAHQAPEVTFSETAAPFADTIFDALARRADPALSAFGLRALMEAGPAHAAERIRALPRDATSLGIDAIAIAGVLAPLDPAAFVAVALSPADDDNLLASCRALTATVAAYPALHPRVRPSALAALWLADRGVVLRLGTAARALRALRVPVPQPEPLGFDDTTLLPVPDALRAALRALYAADPDADATARRLLATDLPDRDRLLTQLDWLHTNDGPPARIAALRRRLDTPVVLSPVRALHLQERLLRAAARAVAERFITDAYHLAQDAIEALLGRPDPWGGRHVDLIAHVLRLAEPYRSLGLRVLRAAADGRDLRDDPKNQAWLAAFGSDLTPWVEGAHLPGPHGTTVHLDPDPLAVLRMGQPFGTCLTPGEINFWSAVVNAADLNKRVLFLRDARGEVIARRLLGLRDDGAVVAFRTYQRDDDGSRQGVMDAAVTALAAVLGLPVVPTGEVRPILAPDWYHDGVSLVGAPRWPTEEQPYQALVRQPSAALRAWAAELLPEALPEHLAAWILRMPSELRRALVSAHRDELVVADLPDDDRRELMHDLDQLRDADGVLRVFVPRGLALLHDADHLLSLPDVARTHLMRTAPRALVRWMRRHRGWRYHEGMGTAVWVEALEAAGLNGEARRAADAGLAQEPTGAWAPFFREVVYRLTGRPNTP